MKILSKNFIRSFGKSILNIHPSLLPKFKGLNTFEKILKKKKKKLVVQFILLMKNLMREK